MTSLLSFLAGVLREFLRDFDASAFAVVLVAFSVEAAGLAVAVEEAVAGAAVCGVAGAEGVAGVAGCVGVLTVFEVVLAASGRVISPFLEAEKTLSAVSFFTLTRERFFLSSLRSSFILSAATFLVAPAMACSSKIL